MGTPNYQTLDTPTAKEAAFQHDLLKGWLNEAMLIGEVIPEVSALLSNPAASERAEFSQLVDEYQDLTGRASSIEATIGVAKVALSATTTSRSMVSRRSPDGIEGLLRMAAPTMACRPPLPNQRC